MYTVYVVLLYENVQMVFQGVASFTVSINLSTLVAFHGRDPFSCAGQSFHTFFFFLCFVTWG